MPDTSPVPFEELYAQRQWVRALALRLVRDPGAADDVEQQTWIAAIEHPPQRGSVRAWLGTVVRSKAWKLRRSGDRRVRHEEAALPRETERRPEEVVAAAEAQRRVVDAVMSLDDPYRATVLLRFFEDVTPTEIARRMDVPLDTVKTRLRRAVDMLRARLDGESEDRRAAWAIPILGIDLFRKATRPAAPLVTATIGATLMTTKQIAAAVVLIAALAGAAAVAMKSDGTNAPPGDGDVAAAASAKATGTHAKRRGDEVADAATDTTSAGPSNAAAPVPEIDRALDLHGEVVTPEGAPIEGAVLRAEPTIPGTSSAASVTTGAEGRFVFRLKLGDVVNLDAQAPGRARVLIAGFQPGEHARIVLPSAVRLVVVVRGSDGAASAGVALRLSHNAPPYFSVAPKSPPRDATTDAAGNAVFDALLPGIDVRVTATASERDAPASETVTLAASGQSSLTITMPRGADLRGRVYDAKSGAGIAAARVELVGGLGTVGSAVTGADGAFHLTGNEPKQSSALRVTAPGFVMTNVEAKAEQFVEAPMRASVPVTARIVDGSGAPIAGARVWATAEGIDLATDKGAIAGPEGRVRLDGMADDARGLVRATARGFGEATAKLEPKPGAAVRDLGEIRLEAAGEIAGTVTRADGTPAARAVVLLQSRSGGQRFSDDLGRFRFLDVPAGSWGIGATESGMPSRFQAVVVSAGATAEVTLVVQAQRDLVIEAVDAGGKPVEGVEFLVQSVDQRNTRVVTGADGKAHALVTGRASAQFQDTKNGLVCDPLNRIVRASQSVARFVALPADHASGVIVGPDGKPLARAQFDVRLGTKFAARLWTDGDGRFDVLVPSRTTASVELVSLRAEAGKPLDDKLFAGRIEFTAGSSNLTLRATPVALDGSLSARVATPDGAPLAGVRVSAYGPVSHFDATSDADGRVRLDGLPVRELSMTAYATAGWQASAPQRATPGDPELTLTLRATSSVAGRVVDADGRPVERAGVVVESAIGGDGRGATTDAEGRFRVEFPADIAAPLAINVQRHSKAGFQDEWLDNVQPGASGLEIVLR